MRIQANAFTHDVSRVLSCPIFTSDTSLEGLDQAFCFHKSPFSPLVVWPFGLMASFYPLCNISAGKDWTQLSDFHFVRPSFCGLSARFTAGWRPIPFTPVNLISEGSLHIRGTVEVVIKRRCASSKDRSSLVCGPLGPRFARFRSLRLPSRASV